MSKRSTATPGLLPAHPERVWSLSQHISQTGWAGLLTKVWQTPSLMGSKEKRLPGHLTFEVWEPPVRSGSQTGSQTSSVQEAGSSWDNKPHPGLRYDTRLVISKLRWVKPDGRRVGKGQGNHFPSPAEITAQAGGQTRSQLCALPGDRTDLQLFRDTFPVGLSP